mmetsp:Transcript_23086/g.64116  ORF Transcript_23086/g.64116 Transcript_23086/m.64116 type:complete len:82 (+) Transcript_23086:110-355(+)
MCALHALTFAAVVAFQRVEEEDPLELTLLLVVVACSVAVAHIHHEAGGQILLVVVDPMVDMAFQEVVASPLVADQALLHTA